MPTEKPWPNEKRAVLILSDGQDTASHSTLDEASAAMRKAGVPVYAIGIELNRAKGNDRSVEPLWVPLKGERSTLDALRRVTQGSGGWTYPIESAKRCKEICIRVADELRNQYVLGYYPVDAARDGRWHDLTVRTTRPEVELFTRAGYFALLR